MSEIGVMQGRLTHRRDRLQSFPNEWEAEFESARDIGFGFIEWVFEDESPLLDSDLGGLMAIPSSSKVRIGSICANYFMDEPLAQNQAMLGRLIRRAREVGAAIIVLPLIERANLSNLYVRNRTLEAVHRYDKDLDRYGVKVALELDLPVDQMVSISSNLSHNVGICYDVGNATSEGKDIMSDLEVLGEHVVEVHVKDRKVGGPTCRIGYGDAELAGFLGKLPSHVPVVLEHFYDHGQDPIAEASRVHAMVRRWLPNG